MLLAARARQQLSPHQESGHVVTWRGKPVKDIKTGARRATQAAGLTWGARDGVTFHTLRHSIATLLAAMGMSERIRMELMGHTEIRTTQRYTHLAAGTQLEPHAQLATQVPLTEAMVSKPRPKAKVLSLAGRRRSA